MAPAATTASALTDSPSCGGTWKGSGRRRSPPSKQQQREEKRMSQLGTSKTQLGPVRKTVTVEASIDHAFKVFTEDIGEWWPIERHSVHGEGALSVGMEARAGGA